MGLPLNLQYQYKLYQIPKLNDFRLILQLSLPNLLKPCVKLRMKMKLEQHQQLMLQIHWVINNFIAY